MHGLKWRRKKGWNGLSSKHLQYKQIEQTRSVTPLHTAILSPFNSFCIPHLDPDCGSARYWHAAFRIGGATEVGNFEAAWHIICTVLYSCIEKRRKTFKIGFTSVSFFHGILIQMGFLAVVRHLQILHISLSPLLGLFYYFYYRVKNN